MTHNERRLLCCVARRFAAQINEQSPASAEFLRHRIDLVQRDAALHEQLRFHRFCRFLVKQIRLTSKAVRGGLGGLLFLVIWAVVALVLEAR